jgi:AcrR family transcriptional regulator
MELTWYSNTTVWHHGSGVPRPATVSPDHLVDALLRVVVAGGLDAVSIRSVVTEAGVSIGAVQHHFATKDDLLHAAYARVIDQFAARARRLIAATPDPRGRIRDLLRELLPLDAQRESELRVALAFSVRSVHNARLSELYTEGYRALTAAVADALREASEGKAGEGKAGGRRGKAGGGDAVEERARQAVALADGLAWHRLCAPDALGPGDALAALDTGLARLLPPASSGQVEER